MKTIKEIFSTNPELMNAPEVVELTEQFRKQFEKIKQEKQAYWDKVTDISMNSELFVIKGTPCKLALERIINISFPNI